MATKTYKIHTDAYTVMRNRLNIPDGYIRLDEMVVGKHIKKTAEDLADRYDLPQVTVIATPQDTGDPVTYTYKSESGFRDQHGSQGASIRE